MKLKKKTLATAKKPRKRKKKPYFGKDAHNAIVEYQGSSCRIEKNKIYEINIEK